MSSTASAQSIKNTQTCVCKRLSKHCFYFSYSHENIFTFLSPSIINVLGYSEDEFAAHYQNYLTDNPGNRKFAQYDQKSFSDSDSPSFEIELFRKDNSICWLEVSETPVFDELKQIIAVEGVAHDITDNKKVEQALKQSINKSKRYDNLQAALDAADAGTFSYDIINDISYWDKKSQQIFDIDTDTFKNNFASWVDLLFEADREFTIAKFEAAIKSTHTRFEFEYRISVTDGSIRWVNVKGQIFRNRQGEAVWIDGLHLNISKTKELEIKLLESENRFRSLVENSPDWIWETDSQGKYSYCSPHIQNLLGYKPSEIIGKTLFSLMPKQERERLSPVLEKFFITQRSFSDIENINLHKNGKQLILETNATPIFDIDGQFIGYRGIHRDITERALSKQLKIEKEIAVLANKSKSEFLANISHELRTPMHAILGFSNLGLNKFNNTPAEKLHSYFKKINQSGERLLSLVNDLLDLSKLETGKQQYHFKAANLMATLQRCLEELETQIQDKRLTITFPSPECNTNAQFDEGKIARVITNILSNAIKFSPSGSNIQVELKTEKLYSDAGVSKGLCCRISDRGVGIPETELELVFDKFAQSTKTKTNAGGTGLGLAICKELINAHHGRIWAEHNPGGGVIFNFIIPLKHVITP